MTFYIHARSKSARSKRAFVPPPSLSVPASRDLPPRSDHLNSSPQINRVIQLDPGPKWSRTICTGVWSPAASYQPDPPREEDNSARAVYINTLAPPPQTDSTSFLGRPLRPNLSASRIQDNLALDSHLRVDTAVDRVGGVILNSHDDYFRDPSEHRAFLEAGGALFSFSCRRGYLLKDEIKIVRAVSILTSFADEVRDNFVPPFDVDDQNDLVRYTYIVQKCSYLLPGVDSASFVNPDFLSTVEYHRECQPVGTRIWTDVKEKRTFRITKPIIKYLFSITVQFLVSALGRGVLDNLEAVVGIPIDRGILLERNRRSKKPPKKLDGTANAKSVLLYTDLKGGVLVTNITCVLHTGIPGIVAHVVDNFGSRGLGEVCETAARTRRYLGDKLSQKSESGLNGTVNGNGVLGPSSADVSVDATHTDISTSFDGDDC